MARPFLLLLSEVEAKFQRGIAICCNKKLVNDQYEGVLVSTDINGSPISTDTPKLADTSDVIGHRMVAPADKVSVVHKQITSFEEMNGSTGNKKHNLVTASTNNHRWV